MDLQLIALDPALVTMAQAPATSVAQAISQAQAGPVALETSQALVGSVALGTTCSKADKWLLYIQIRLYKIHCIPDNPRNDH